MKKRRIEVRTIVATGLLLAVEVVLQLLSSIIPTGVNLNLSLAVITIGALLYGPAVGAFLGFASGAIVLASPNTVSVFMAISLPATIVTCLVKTTLAGLVAGFVSKLFKKNDFVGSIVASMLVPIINTGFFVIMTYFFFMKGLGLANFWSIFTVLIGVNFIFEIVTNTIICPILYKITKQVKNNNQPKPKLENKNDTLE